MSFEMDEELCEDFLVETGETLEQLGTHLVDLEQRPDDQDLLNKVFRGFHNIKGGAGFLGLTALVEICHRAEDVFNVLRQGDRMVDAQLMDTILQAVDVINVMVDQVREREELVPAEPDLLARLGELAVPQAAAAPEPPAQVEAVQPQPAAPATQAEPVARGDAAEGDITDQEFEALLDAIGAPADPAASKIAAGDDEISDDEFESLLDELHGAGKHGGVPRQSEATSPAASSIAAGDDEISDEEFESLLAELHGAGKHGGMPAAAAQQAAPSPSAAVGNGSTPPPMGGDEITDDEFEALLDKLHGEGRFGAAAGAQPAKGNGGTPPSAAGQARQSTPAPRPAAAKPAAPAKPAAVRSQTEAREAAKGDTTVRVDTRRLDDMMNMVGELVLVRNRLASLRATQADEDLATVVGNLDVVTSDLQLAVMKTRMQPIKKVFGRFPRVVRDLARSLKKEVVLEMQGEETDLDKNLVDALADPLVHLVRNAVDHGIEMPEEREAAGKPRVGTVVLTAQQEGDHILLTIEDDGSGMEAERLRKKAVEKGLLDADAAARLENSECYNLIFMPGFSVKTEISDVSGRGVGMDVVKTTIAQLNGSIDIDTRLGNGTRFSIKVPLTLAIMPTLMVMIGEQIFAFPLLSIVEIVEFDRTQTKTIDGQLVMLLRDKALPLFHLRQWLLNGTQRHTRSETGHVVIVGVGSQRVGFVVDQLLGQEEVVIKPLGAMLQGTPGLAGATITGNGRIALILDVPGLIKGNASRMWEVA